jgi:hypothetical protein
MAVPGLEPRGIELVEDAAALVIGGDPRQRHRPGSESVQCVQPLQGMCGRRVEQQPGAFGHSLRAPLEDRDLDAAGRQRTGGPEPADGAAHHDCARHGLASL